MQASAATTSLKIRSCDNHDSQKDGAFFLSSAAEDGSASMNEIICRIDVHANSKYTRTRSTAKAAAPKTLGA